jgi:hypothetical protein
MTDVTIQHDVTIYGQQLYLQHSLLNAVFFILLPVVQC